MDDLQGKLPPQERNALLVLFSKENQQLKTQIINQQRLIEELREKLKTNVIE